MVTNRCFEGKKILVTRPAHQAAALVSAISQQGGIAVELAAINIEWQKVDIKQVFDAYIFISPNAVAGFVKSGLVVASSSLYAVGKATAKALELAGYQRIIVPETGADSEALLQLETLQNCDGLQFAIVRGCGGRELLANELRERGATISYLEVYKRAKAIYTNEVIAQTLKQGIDLIIATSNEILDNIVLLLLNHINVRKIPLLVISLRMLEYATAQGFEQVILANGASTEAIVQGICHG